MKDPLIHSDLLRRLTRAADQRCLERPFEKRARRNARRARIETRFKNILIRIFTSVLFVAATAGIAVFEPLTHEGRVAALAMWSLVVVDFHHRRTRQLLLSSPDFQALSLWPVPTATVTARQFQRALGNLFFGPSFLTFLACFSLAALYWRPSALALAAAVIAAIAQRLICEILSVLALRWSVISYIASCTTACAWLMLIVGRIPSVQETLVRLLNSWGSTLSLVIPFGWSLRQILPMPITDESLQRSLALLALLGIWLPFLAAWLRRKSRESHSLWFESARNQSWDESSTLSIPSEPSGADSHDEPAHPVSVSGPTPAAALTDSKNHDLRIHIRQAVDDRGMPSRSEESGSPFLKNSFWSRLSLHERVVWNLNNETAPELLSKFKRSCAIILVSWTALLLRRMWPSIDVLAQFLPQTLVLLASICWQFQRGFRPHGWMNHAYPLTALTPVRCRDIHRIHLKHGLWMSALLIVPLGLHQIVIMNVVQTSWTGLEALIMALKWTLLIIPVHQMRAASLSGSVTTTFRNLTLRNVAIMIPISIILIAGLICLACTAAQQGWVSLLYSVGAAACSTCIVWLFSWSNNRRWHDLGTVHQTNP